VLAESSAKKLGKQNQLLFWLSAVPGCDKAMKAIKTRRKLSIQVDFSAVLQLNLLLLLPALLISINPQSSG
jgi:hypothetical protein